MPTPRRPRALVGALLVAATASGLAGCGRGDEVAALAIESVEWSDATHLFVYTECATLTDVEVDRSGEVPEVSLWGRPKVGRCEEWAVIKVAVGTTKITDGATSKVVDLPPAPDPADAGSGHGSGHD